MDPIHPIIPVPPNIPPVTPAPLIGRIDRDDARQSADEGKRRRRPRPEPALDATETLDGDDDTGLHISVTA